MDFKQSFDNLINEAISNNVPNSELIQVLSGKLAALNAIESEPATASEPETTPQPEQAPEQSSDAPVTTEQQAA